LRCSPATARVYLFQARTDIYGRAENVVVARGVDPLLDRAAVDAVRQWVYEPEVVGGKPRSAEFTVQVKFALDKEKKGKGGEVTAGVTGGVEGGVSAGVEGGVGKGGASGVSGSVRDDKKLEEFAAGAVKVKDGIQPPRLIKKVNPVYSEVARLAEVEGVVILQVRTDVNGQVKDAIILRSVPLLDQAAMDAVRQWVYEPVIVDGQAVGITFTVTVRFKLD